MNRRVRWAMGTALAALAASITPQGLAQDRSLHTPPDPEAFRNPPPETRPQMLYPWPSGPLTKERIDADLQAMRDLGFGGVMVVEGGDDGSRAAPEALSPQWLDLMTHMIGKADQLGLKVGLRWSSPGGPWIAPEQATQQLVWAESRVTGDGEVPVSIQLPQPHTSLGHYRDAAVIAFPASPGDEIAYRDAVEAMEADMSIMPATLTDSDPGSAVKLSPPAPLVVTMKAPFAAQAVTLRAANDAPAFSAIVDASADGVTWSRVGKVDVGAGRGITSSGTLNFPSVEASMFRITPSGRVQLTEALFYATPRIDQWQSKAGYGVAKIAPAEKPTLDLKARYAIDPTQVIDISAHVDAAGTLNWTPPAGEWTILRFGHTPTSQFEVDRLSTAAVDHQFDNTIARLVKAAGPLAGKTFDSIEIGNGEAGFQTWTRALPTDFQKRNGYAIIPYLPALTGRIVGDLDVSNRFLFDFRRTLAGLMGDNYHGRMQERANRAGLKLLVQGHGSDMAAALQASGRAHVPMAGQQSSAIETDNPTLKIATSAGHVYGKTIIAAEAFAADARTSYPNALKAPTDQLFAQGANQLFLHRQGPQAKPWTEYLSRSQYLLRQGVPVVDVLYFVGEDGPAEHVRLQLPAGYQYDLVDAEALLTRARVKDGRIVLANGAAYRLLVIPRDLAGMTPQLAARVRELVEAGMAVLGPKPAHPMTLAGKADNDAGFRAAVDAVWGDGKTRRKSGAGRVFPHGSVDDALTALKVAPDAACRTATPDGQLAWLHRKAGATHLYFVANSQRRTERVTCTFRVGSAAPSLWDAQTGTVTRATLFKTERDWTEVTFDLSPAGATFVTLDFAAGARRIDWVAKDGVRFIDTTATVAPARVEAPAEVSRDRYGDLQALVRESGAYTTSDGGRFKAEVPRPIVVAGPWDASPTPTRGAVIYRRSVDIPEDALRKGRRIFLDLGQAQIPTGVRVNGKDLGMAWKEPGRVEITDAAKPGSNAIELAVTRLKADHTTADAPPPDSSLPGPVRVVFADLVKVE
jgi:alpha-L-rhamnosidase